MVLNGREFMKKFLTLAVAAAVLSATVSALTFKVDGYARAGLTSTLNTKNKDGDKEAKTVSTKQWLADDYFGGGSRLRLNGDILSDDGTAGVKFRFQYTGSFEDFDITKDEVKYVYAWGKGFDGKVIAGAGKIGDKYISSDGWEGFSLIDGKTGVFAGYTPIEGLTLLAAVVKDYLVEEEIAELDDNGNYKKEKKFDKRAGVYGFKYSAGILTVDAAFSGAGRFYANVNLTPSNLLAALEYAYESDDALDDGTSPWYSKTHTFCEQIEFTGIPNLLLAAESYQFIDKDDNLSVTITPAAKYTLSETFALTAEATIYAEDEAKNDFDAYATIVPGVEINFTDSFTVNAYGSVSTDSDQAAHLIGIGCKKSF